MGGWLGLGRPSAGQGGVKVLPATVYEFQTPPCGATRPRRLCVARRSRQPSRTEPNLLFLPTFSGSILSWSDGAVANGATVPRAISHCGDGGVGIRISREKYQRSAARRHPADAIGHPGANYQASTPRPPGGVCNRPNTRDERHITEHMYGQLVIPVVGFTAHAPAPATREMNTAAAACIQARGRRCFCIRTWH